MYADRLEQVSKQSIGDRLNGIVVNDSVRRRPLTGNGKRQRQYDKWEHDLYDDDGLQLSKLKARKLDARDLRVKLQKKSTPQAPQNGGVRDLREKLSGIIHAQPVNSNHAMPKGEHEKNKPTIKSVIGDALLVGSRNVSSSVAKKKSRRKAGASVDEFLQSLGLEKYQIQLRLEEVDTMALKHMTDEDLQAMGIPMGPRKKILLALSSSS